MTEAEVASVPPREALRLQLRGVVQGVGLRPFVLREARARGLAGRVLNDGAGVVVEAEGAPAALATFAAQLAARAPAAARIESVAREPLAVRGRTDFVIDASAAEGRGALPGPDLALCDDCRAEIGNPAARRYRYPFTSCTCCGPRYSIAHAAPFDRARTTMAPFTPCTACRAEYDDPADRRCHAQTLACPACGPRLRYGDASGSWRDDADAALDAAVAAISAGDVLAIKGLGGFQFVVRADDDAAVARLRRRKARGDKPFAVMVSDAGVAAREVCLDATARTLLESAAAPIVIAARAAGGRIAAACAPGCPDLGVMLPTTPLHALLVDGVGAPLVVTSGNRAGEPLCRDGDEARVRLAGIADAFLDHDRAIVQPLDDSVLRVDDGHVTLLRRARGYSPLPLEVPLKADVPLVPTLACGGALKNAIALAAGDRVWLGPHLGDLDDLHAQARYAQGIDALQAMTGVVPERIAHDRHPDYPSTRYVATRVEPAVAVQHHHAHVAACMAEHGLDERVLGIAWDGSGDGGDGSVWGGEWLETDYTQCTRIAHLRPFRLAGAEAAIREPRRVALALLSGCGRLGAAAALGFDARTQANLGVLIERGFNAPSTSSVGRLFDGVSAVLGLCHESAFEGEAAMRLEWAARSADQSTQRAYPLPLDVTVSPWQLDWRPLLRDVIDDHAAGVAVATIALGFHHALADAALVVARRAERRVVCLGGGCFQNALLARLVRARLVAAGLRVYAPARVPPNDGGLALGQAVVAARQAEC